MTKAHPIKSLICFRKFRIMKKPNIKLIQNYKSLLNGIRPVVVDIGARGGGKGNWIYELNSVVDYVFFEPDKDESENLMKKYGSNTTVIPSAVWNKSGTIELNITKNRSYCSILEPNEEVIKGSFYYDRGFYEIENTLEVKCDALEPLLNQYNCSLPDFIKIDIQGGEKIVFESLKKSTWNNLIGIDTESYSSHLYKECANISDLLQILYINDFELYNIDPIANFAYTSHSLNKIYDSKNLNRRPNSSQYYGKNMVFDLLLIKTFESILTNGSEKFFRKSLFILVLYKYYDHAMYLLYEAIEKDIINDKIFKNLKHLIKENIDLNSNFLKKARERYKVRNYKL